jgi:hypothetical protein
VKTENKSIQEDEAQTSVGALKGIFSTLSVLGSILASVSLISNLASIGLSGFTLKVIEQYVKFRDSIFSPIIWVLQILKIQMPSGLRDILVIYLLFASAMYYAGLTRHRRDLKEYRTNSMDFENNVKAAALVAGKDPEKVWLTVVGGLTQKSKFLFLRNALNSLLWPQKLTINIIRTVSGNLHERKQTKEFLLRLFAVFCGTFAFFIWNYANSL